MPAFLHFVSVQFSANKNDKVIFTDEAKALIREIAEVCREAPAFKNNEETYRQYSQGLTAEQVYIDMLNKINNAPSMLHMILTPRLLIPVLDLKLKKSGAYSSSQ